MKENPNLTKKKKIIILTEFKDLACPLILYTHLRSFFLWKILTKKNLVFDLCVISDSVVSWKAEFESKRVNFFLLFY